MFHKVPTVSMISIAHSSVHILLLHHYRSDLAHLSDLESLVIGMSQSERWAKSNLKMNDYYYMNEICTLLSSFSQKIYGQKVFNI